MLAAPRAYRIIRRACGACRARCQAAPVAFARLMTRAQRHGGDVEARPAARGPSACARAVAFPASARRACTHRAGRPGTTSPRVRMTTAARDAARACRQRQGPLRPTDQTTPLPFGSNLT